MLVAEKPPLDEDLLAHFGIKGMKWGKRKARPTAPAKSSKAAPKKTWSTKRKVAVGATVVAGAAAAAYVLSRSGSRPVSRIKFTRYEPKPSAWARIQEMRDMKVSNFNQVAPTFRKTMVWDAATNQFAVPASTSGGISRALVRTRSPQPKLGDLSAVRRALNDPSHIWEL